MIGLAVPVLHHEAHLGLSPQPAQHSHGPGPGQLRGESDINQETKIFSAKYSKVSLHLTFLTDRDRP